MKKKRTEKRNDPEYIDLFADEPEEDSPAVENLFEEDDGAGRVPSAPKKKKAAPLPAEDGEDEFSIDGEEIAPARYEKPAARKAAPAPVAGEDEEDEEDAPRKPAKKKGLIARAKALLSDEDDEEDEDEDEDYPGEEADETPAFTSLRKPGEDEEDWDIGDDIVNPYEAGGMPALEEPEEEAPAVGAAFSFEHADKSAAGEDEEPFFSFDHYGRRKNAKKKTLYGRRKNAPHATVSVVTNETDAMRDYMEAQARNRARESIRDRELKKQKLERKANLLRELRMRLTTAAMLAGLGVIVLIAAFFLFRVTSIEVNGSSIRYSAEDVVARSGLVRGRHILLQDLDEAEALLNEDPYLNASVRYVFPNKITVTVQERKGLGAVQWGPNNEYTALIDNQGNVLDARLESSAGYPLIRGLVVTRVVAGSKIGDDADEQLQSTLDMLTKLDEYGLIHKITVLDMTETMGISMYTPENYRIEVGSVSDLDMKLNARLKKNYDAIMARAAAYRSDVITIYLYSKNGVTVSPHDVGYEVPDETLNEVPVAPGAGDFGGYNEFLATPEPTPEPTPDAPATPPPFNNGPFSG